MRIKVSEKVCLLDYCNVSEFDEVNISPVIVVYHDITLFTSIELVCSSLDFADLRLS